MMQAADRLSRFVRSRARRYHRHRPTVLLEVVERHAAQLRADGVEVVLIGHSELDLADLLAASGVPFRVEPGLGLHLDTWLADTGAGRRDLTALAAHPAFREPFRDACVRLLGSIGPLRRPGAPLNDNVLDHVMSVPGIAAGLTDAVAGLTGRARRAPAGEVLQILRHLTPLRSAAGYRWFGRHLDRLGDVDAEETLARTLRCGLAEELTWPPFDAAIGELRGKVRVDAAWPLLVVHDDEAALVLDGSEIVARRRPDLPDRPPPPATREGVLRLPGGDRRATVDAFGAVAVLDPATGEVGSGPYHCPDLPPIEWWHLLEPRDPAGSAALRRGDPWGVHEPVLRAAAGREVQAATQLAEALARFTAGREAAPAIPFEAHDDNLRNAFAGFWRPPGPDDRRNARPSPMSGYTTMETIAALGTGATAGLPVAGWTRPLGALGALLLRAGLATTPEPEHAALAAFLTAVADAGLADASAGLRLLTVHAGGEPADRVALLQRLAGQTAEHVMDYPEHACLRLVTRGEPPAADGLQIVDETPLGTWGDTATVRRFVSLLDARGPVPWQPAWGPPAAAALGVDVATATTLATGAVFVTAGEVPQWYLEATALSPTAERAAAAALDTLPGERLLRLLDAAMPRDPERLWTHGPDVTALAAAWTT